MSLLWSLVAGGLPPGLSLGSDGTISGTPTRSGTYLFTVEVADDGGDIDTQALAITVYAPIVLAGPLPGARGNSCTARCSRRAAIPATSGRPPPGR